MWNKRWKTGCSLFKSIKYYYFCSLDGRCVSPIWWTKVAIFNWFELRTSTPSIVSHPSTTGQSYWHNFFTVIDDPHYFSIQTFLLIWKNPLMIVECWVSCTYHTVLTAWTQYLNTDKIAMVNIKHLLHGIWCAHIKHMERSLQPIII